MVRDTRVFEARAGRGLWGAAGMTEVVMAKKARPLIAAVLAIAVVFVPKPARAQQAAERIDRIEVTGSRLASSDAESSSPLVVIKSEDIKLEGYQQLELLLANYPQFHGAWGGRINNSSPGVAPGTATLNLRGLGDARTLTLVNGRRLPPGMSSHWRPTSTRSRRRSSSASRS